MGGVVVGRMADTVDLTPSGEDGSRPVDLTASDEEGSSPADLTAVADVENFTSPTVVDDLPPDFWMAVANRMRGHRTACKLHQVSRTARDGVSKSEVWRRLADNRGLVDDPDDARHIKTRYARHVTEREDLLNDLGNIGDWETRQTPSQETRQGWSIPYHIAMAVHDMRRTPRYRSAFGHADWSKVINFEAPLAELVLKPAGDGHSSPSKDAAALLNYDTVLFSTGRGLSADHVVIVSAVLAAVYTCVAKPFSRVILIVDSYLVDFAFTTCRQLLLEHWIVRVQSIDDDDDGSPTVVEIALRNSSTLVISSFDCCIDVGAEMDATAAIEVDTGVIWVPVEKQRHQRKWGKVHARWLERYDPDVLVTPRTQALPYRFGVGGGIPFLMFLLDDGILVARNVTITSCIERVAIVTATETATAATTT